MAAAEPEGRVMSGKVLIMERKLDQDAIVSQLRRMNSWFHGLIPPRKFEVGQIVDVFEPYLLVEIWYRRTVKKWRRCFILENLTTGKRKGVLGTDNIAWEEIEGPADLPAIAYDREEFIRDLRSYCLLQMLPRHHRTFVNWELEIKEIRGFYRIKRTISYKVNDHPRTHHIFLDSFVLK